MSTEEQGTDPQLDELRAAGCATVHEEHASGADRSWPVLARLLRDIGLGETLVVVRLDRQSGRNCAPPAAAQDSKGTSPAATRPVLTHLLREIRPGDFGM